MFRGKVNALFLGLRILKHSLHLNEKDKKKSLMSLADICEEWKMNKLTHSD